MLTYHFFVVLLINADHRLLYDNVSDFREVRKIVPLFSDFVFLLILLVFIFQFFPFQFIFFLFSRNNLTTCIKVRELSVAFLCSVGSRSVLLGNQYRALHPRRRSQPAWISEEVGEGTVGLGWQFWVPSGSNGFDTWRRP